MPGCSLALFEQFRLLWELFAKKGNHAAYFENLRNWKIRSIPVVVDKKNAKNLLNPESFKKKHTYPIWKYLDLE